MAKNKREYIKFVIEINFATTTTNSRQSRMFRQALDSLIDSLVGFYNGFSQTSVDSSIWEEMTNSHPELLEQPHE